MRHESLVPVLLCVFAAMPAAAQEIPIRTLMRPDHEIPGAFGCINSLRELSDGRVIVANPGEKLLRLIDPRSGMAIDIGRQGKADGEWAVPATLFAGPGDTTFVWDPGNSRILTILPDGGTDRSFATRPEGREGQGIPPTPRAVDRLGRVYLVASELTRNPSGGPGLRADSVAVLRFDPATAVLDTAAFLPTPRINGSGDQSGNARATMVTSPNPLAPQVAWTVTSDGRVVVVHPEPYHVEIIASTKERRNGPAIPYAPVPVTEADKDAPAAPGPLGPCATMVPVTRVSGRPPADTVRSAGPPKSAAELLAGLARPKRTDWPATKPAFIGGIQVTGTAMSASDGSVWVLRVPAVNEDVRTYDVFDGQGRLSARIAIPTAARLLGFGSGTVYLSRPGPNGRVSIQRYRIDSPIPPAG